MKKILFSLILAGCCLSPLANAQSFSSPPPEIVSAWKSTTENTVAVFTHDGQFYAILDNADAVGMERGTFTWDRGTHAFQAETTVDTNGTAGFSHPDGDTSITISGNTMIYTVDGEGSFNFTRVVNTVTPIVGSWYVPGDKVTLTFLANGTYYLAQDANELPDGYDGMERGTYTWNATNKKLSVGPSVDTNGDYGLSSLTASATANISGNTLTLLDGSETFNLRRITPVASPLNTETDFEVDKVTNYRQISNAAPALRTGSPSNGSDDFPFWGESYFESSISGTGGTLSITGKPAISFVNDGGWSIETEHTTLSALNDAFPNGANYVFARTGGSATLSYPVGGNFLAAPKIQLGEGAWSGGKYLLGANQTITWSPIPGYDPATHVTVISVVDITSYEELLYEDIIQGDITSYDLSGKLTPGHNYEVQIEHIKIASSTISGTGPFAGKLGYALYNSNTRIVMVAPSVPPAPSITGQPVSQPGITGALLLLNVGINDEAFDSSTFQWFRNNLEIEGQTGNSLSIPSFNSANDSGRYRVAVTGSGVTATSNVAYVGNSSNLTRGVERLTVSKSKIFQQQSSSLLVDFGAGFDARVEGFGITTSFPASAITVTKPNSSTVILAVDGDHWDAETSFASFAALQSSFPDGSYSIKIGADSTTIDMTAGLYPNQPLVTASTGTWVNGKLRITASQAAAGFTLTTNSTTGNGYIDLSIHDSNDDNIFDVNAHNSPEDPEFATGAVPAGLLTVGQTYQAEAGFDNSSISSDISTNSWATDDGIAFGLFSTSTFFSIEVVADPVGDTYTDWQSEFFTPTQLANPAISGDTVDFDNDGVPNLIEFILGGDPATPSSGLIKSATTTPDGTGKKLVFYYDRKKGSESIAQVIQVSSSLTGASWIPTSAIPGATVGVTSLNETTERVTATVPTTDPKLFVRLSATR